jgi:cold shock protein
MPSGRVKFFNTDRGYGFIAPNDGGPDVFVHVHDIEAAGMKILVAGQLVAYEIGPARDGRSKALRLFPPPALRECGHWRAVFVIPEVGRPHPGRSDWSRVHLHGPADRNVIAKASGRSSRACCGLTPATSRRTSIRKLSCLISCSHAAPVGGLSARLGGQGS